MNKFQFRHSQSPVLIKLDMEGPDLFIDDFYHFHVKEGVTVGQLVSEEIKELAAPHWIHFPPSHPFIADFLLLYHPMDSLSYFSLRILVSGPLRTSLFSFYVFLILFCCLPMVFLSPCLPFLKTIGVIVDSVGQSVVGCLSSP